MRCFCIIRYTDSLPAWRTGIRPKRSAGCNEKSPSVARGSTYFRVRPASPFLSLFSSFSPLSLLPLFLSPSVFLSSSLCRFSATLLFFALWLNLRVSETGRAMPKARVLLLHLFVWLSLAHPLSFSLFLFLVLPFILASLPHRFYFLAWAALKVFVFANPSSSATVPRNCVADCPAGHAVIPQRLRRRIVFLLRETAERRLRVSSSKRSDSACLVYKIFI